MNCENAILVVSFGTAHLDTLEKTIGAIEQQIRTAFPACEVFRAFTSQVILDKLRRNHNLSFDNVKQAMGRMSDRGVKRVIVQPTHIINGIENEQMVNALMEYKDDFEWIRIGKPLLGNQADYQKATLAVMEAVKPEEGEVLVLMGHGTVHDANAAYQVLEDTFHAMGYHQVLVGTVEGEPDFGHVLERLRKADVKAVRLMPFMIVAGDHARNDLAGNENSWKTQLEAAGYKVSVMMQGLGELDGIRDIFIGHMNGTLYGIGVGPGDPELLTIKALKKLKECPVLAIPVSDSALTEAVFEYGGQNSRFSDYLEACLAYQIVRSVLPELDEKDKLYLPMPMTKDPARLAAMHGQGAAAAAEQLKQGKDIAFITLGDPSIYSTYLYIHRRVLAMGYETAIVPGIPSFCAAAACLNQGLAENSDQLHLLPGSYQIEQSLDLPGTKVLMKMGRKMPQVKELVKEKRLNIRMVENCGLRSERIFTDVDQIPDESSYYSLIIIKGDNQ